MTQSVNVPPVSTPMRIEDLDAEKYTAH